MLTRFVRTRRLPYRTDFDLLRDQLEDLFEGSLPSRMNGLLDGKSEERHGSIPLELTETDEAYKVRLLMPDLKQEDIKVKATQNSLRVEAEKKLNPPEESETIHFREFQYGKMLRSIELPNLIDAKAIEARYEQGVLNITLPKMEDEREKTVDIQIQT
jgi:HSP20 family protein